VWRARPRAAPVGFPGEWFWSPRPHPARRTEELVRFRGTLAAALRAGHGLGCAFELRFGSGSTPILSIGGSDFPTARWLTRVLMPAYIGAPWVRRPAHGITPGAQAFASGRRVRAWPEAFRDPDDGPPAAESLLLALTGVPPGIVVRWAFKPWPASWPRRLESWNHDTEIDARSHPVRLPERRSRTTPPERLGVHLAPLFWESRFEVEAATGRFPAAELNPVRSAVEAALRSKHGNGVRISRRHWAGPWSKPWFAVTEAELASILPGAGGDPTLTGPPLGRETLPILPLGRTLSGRVIGPPIEPGQGRHLAILGETGMGKSSALVAVARKAATLGGLVLFDPLGETARSFRAGLSPEELRRLLWVSPDSRPRGINALEGIHGPGNDAVVADRRLNDLVYALRRVRSGRYSESSFWGPRLEEMVSRALLAAASFPGGTLVDAHTLLATGGRTRQIVPAEAQEAVRSLSDRIRERPEDADGARRLLYEVVRSPVLNAQLCERDPDLHPRDLVEPNRIAVISGDASTVGESAARYLLAVYLALVWSELLGRTSQAKVFVVLDECQWFSHESLAEMLRLSRRRNVHVFLATQAVRSLPETVADAVWTNVSDFLAFRGSPDEARELSRASVGLTVEEILALPRGHALLLLGKGSGVHWVRSAGRPAASENDQVPSRPERSKDAPAPEGSEKKPPLTAEDLLRNLRARAIELAPGSVLRVELSELRRSALADDRVIREVGARLGRAGALVAAERSSGATIWVVDPTRIPSPAVGTVASPSPGATEVPQPS
jgi:hypothetical protein